MLFRLRIDGVVANGGGEVGRLLLVEGAEDWNDGGGDGGQGGRRRRKMVDHNHPFGKSVDPHGWRDAVADALDDASGVFENAKRLTREDLTKYVIE